MPSTSTKLNRLDAEREALIQQLIQSFNRWKKRIKRADTKDVAQQITTAISKQNWNQVCSLLNINSLTYPGLKPVLRISEEVVQKRDEKDDELDLLQRSRHKFPSREYYDYRPKKGKEPIKATRFEEQYQ